MHQLTRREAALLGAETITNLGHYSVYLEIGPDAEGQHLSFHRLRGLIEQNLPLAPSLRRRVREVPWALDEPWWIEDPHFDLEFHVRHVAVPGAGDPNALEQLLGRLHERALDRKRPLWELYLIDLPNGSHGLFIKVHVVLTDALGPLGPLTPALSGDAADGVEPTPWRPDMVPSDQDLLIKAGWSTIRSPFRSWQRSMQLAQRLPVVGRLAFLAANISTTRPHPVERARGDQAVPRTSFNRTLGSHRRVARVELPVADLRAARRALDVKFHDVLLAVISGALRHWLVVNDELIAEPLVALTPLVVDPKRDRLGAALVPIATERHDPLQRVADISTALTEISQQLAPSSVEAIREREGVPTSLAGTASQLLVTSSANVRFMPPFNVYVVNIPGGDFNDIDGYPIVSKHALCPVIDGIGLSISAISLGDSVHVTLVSDRDLVPDLQMMADQLPMELALLTAAIKESANTTAVG
jgi:diacylglycerol O-acyltransferase